MGLNILFGLLGLTLLGIGGYVMTEVKKYQGVTEDSYDSIPIFIICLGLFVFLISFFGCFGALKKNSCMTMTYCVVLGILVICQIGAGIAGFVLKDDLINSLETELTKTMPQWAVVPESYNMLEYNDVIDFTVDVADGPKDDSIEYNVVADGWNLVQDGFKCCGVNSYEDWTNTTIMKSDADSGFMQFIKSRQNPAWNQTITPYPVPSACCKESDSLKTPCGYTYVKEDVNESIYTDGCLVTVDDWLDDNIAIIAGAAVGIAVVEIVGVLFGCYLIKSENGYNAYSYA